MLLQNASMQHLKPEGIIAQKSRTSIKKIHKNKIQFNLENIRFVKILFIVLLCGMFLPVSTKQNARPDAAFIETGKRENMKVTVEITATGE